MISIAAIAAAAATAAVSATSAAVTITRALLQLQEHFALRVGHRGHLGLCYKAQHARVKKTNVYKLRTTYVIYACMYLCVL